MHHIQVAPGDLGRDHQVDSIPPNSVVVAVDVDHFIPDISCLFTTMSPVAIYAFNPVSTAGTDGDCHFTINNNVVTYVVGGGGRWEHRTHDWCKPGEFIQCPLKAPGFWPGFRDKVLGLAGIEKVGVHKVHFARPWESSKHRALIWTVPCNAYWRVTWLPTVLRGVRDIGYVNYQDRSAPGWNRIEHVDASGNMCVSVGREGEQATTTIKLEHMDLLLHQASTQAVSTTLMALGYNDADSATTMRHIAQYYMATRNNLDPHAPSFGSLASVRPHQVSEPFVPKVHWPVGLMSSPQEVRCNARAYAAPIMADSALAPHLGDAGVMAETIVRRVTAVVNTQVPSGPTGEYYRKLVKEFVELVVPVKHELEPYTMDEVIEALDKPSQKSLINSVVDSLSGLPSSTISSFLKDEATNKTPRLISGFKDIRYVAHVSRFAIVATKRLLKRCPWYFSGSTPTEIVEGVAAYFRLHRGEISETDFTNMDGTISAWLQHEVLGAVLKRAFKPEYRAEIDKIVHQLVSSAARSKKFGFRYDAGPGVKSGSPTTTLGNTLFNAVMEYITIRKLFPTLPKEDVFAGLGPKAGDDGLTMQLAGPEMVLTCQAFGLTLKVEKYNPEAGVCFLGRVFTCLDCCTHSIQDPLRTLEKLHLTFRHRDVPLADAGYDRCESYLITDSKTPIIGEYCRMVHRIVGKEINHSKRLARKDRQRDATYWTIDTHNSWPQEDDKYDSTVSLISYRIGVDAGVIRYMCERYDAATSLWDIPFVHRPDVPTRHKFHIEDDGTVDMSVVLSYKDTSTQINECLRDLRPITGSSSSSADSGQGSSRSSPESDLQRGHASSHQAGLQSPRRDRGKGKKHGHGHQGKAKLPNGAGNNRGGKSGPGPRHREPGAGNRQPSTAGSTPKSGDTRTQQARRNQAHVSQRAP